jgi:sugar/nucleoside kinase (ribokinase family)
MTSTDITFIGHICYDEITDHTGHTRIGPGSAVLCGAAAAARVGARTAVVTRCNPEDQSILSLLQPLGVNITILPTPETSWSKVVHPSPDPDERAIYLLKSAGRFGIEEVPALDSHFVHLAGISDQEFDLDFVQGLRARVECLSADLQAFVRQVDPVTRQVHFRDVKDKKALVSLLDLVKLDVVEAQVLTGTSDLAAAAEIIAGWGCTEVVVTQGQGVLARVRGKIFYQRFTNRSLAGRTGRGDTTFAAYLSQRLLQPPEEALKFAAALVSIKMETPGPFAGTLADVLARMHESD